MHLYIFGLRKGEIYNYCSYKVILFLILQLILKTQCMLIYAGFFMLEVRTISVKEKKNIQQFKIKIYPQTNFKLNYLYLYFASIICNWTIDDCPK